MSGLYNITYQTVVDAVKTYIKENCSNISSFVDISSIFKNGYTNDLTIPGGNDYATCYCTISLIGNEIQQATTSDVDTDMNAFLQSIIPAAVLSQPITDSELIKFINDMVIFCSARMSYSTSIYDTSKKYLVYNKEQSTSDFNWEYETDSSISRQVFNHLVDDIGYSEVYYYKCTSKEEGDILYTTRINYVPDNIDMTTYNYLMDYITTHGILPSGAEATDQNISDEYVVLTGLSPLVYDISDYTYTYDGTDFTPLSDTESSVYFGEILYDEEHFVIDENDYIKIVSYSVTPQQETIGSYTITYYPAQDGHKIVLPNMEQIVLDIWNESHICTYYVLDVDNRRFKYPIGINPESYEDIELISSHGHADKEIELTDVESIVNAVVDITKKSIRCVAVQYSYEYIGQKPSDAIITINPSPSDATVTISSNGTQLISGVGAQTVQVAYNTSLSYVVSRTDYYTSSGSLTAAGTQTIPVKLSSDYFFVKINCTSPAGATILLNNEEISNDTVIKILRNGDVYRTVPIKITYPKYFSYDSTFTMYSSEVKELNELKGSLKTYYYLNDIATSTPIKEVITIPENCYSLKVTGYGGPDDSNYVGDTIQGTIDGNCYMSVSPGEKFNLCIRRKYTGESVLEPLSMFCECLISEENDTSFTNPILCVSDNNTSYSNSQRITGFRAFPMISGKPSAIIQVDIV